MKIAIIGAGNIGGTLARRLTALGHDVSIANSRGPDTLADLAAETGVRPCAVGDVAAGAELVVVTIPMKRVPDLPRDALDAAAPGAIVIDTNNYYPQQRDGRIEEIENGMTESRWVSEQLGRPVVKAFNNILADHLLRSGKPAGAEDRIALPIAGDDDRAKATVIRLLDDLGFDAVDVGDLDESWRQQPGTPVYGTDLDEAALRAALGATDPERPAEFRAQG